MIPLSSWEELSRRRTYSILDSTETFRVLGLVGSKDFADPQYHWQLFTFLCVSSRGGYVLAKEMHQFPESWWNSEPCSRDTFFSLDLIDLNQEEAGQYRLILKQTYENPQFQKPPLIL